MTRVHRVLSRTQLDKLGDRLRDAPEPSSADLDLLEAFLAGYDEALQIIERIAHDLGLQPTSRLKTTGTVIDKLRRDRRSSLKTVQDLAGARIVVDADLVEQDETVRFFCAALQANGFGGRVVDRRVDPRSGYRAVHVVAKVGAVPVEVQFRTELQDLWAQVFERLADGWGRQIRFGGDPDPDVRSEGLRRWLVARLISVSRNIARLEVRFVAIRVLFSGEPAGVLANNDHRTLVSHSRRAVEMLRKALIRLADLVERR
ncbi:hypothetical protein [Actinoplanes solisilvae]|uniref:hypothetical protein n=1 Tax=Actinoplanes solisilvae TaxID=2486853 RepID=UPI0013E349BE|nr:hypothetical protein [Actinoplanes solisilvae]